MRMMQYNAASAKTPDTRVVWSTCFHCFIVGNWELNSPVGFLPPTMSSKGRASGQWFGDGILENPTRPTAT